jgi:protein tyrosine phosphatase
VVAQQKLSNKVQKVAFRSGESVPVSGMWLTEHATCKNAPEIWIRKDDLFPHCLACGRTASFTLLEEIQHITEDADFS